MAAQSLLASALRRTVALLVLFALLLSLPAAAAEAPASREQVIAAMKKAATFYRSKVALRGGYVYYYSPDLSRRLGEGKASAQQIWVQPPGTPSVGMALLQAHAATGDPYYLEAARETAEALVFGQLESGGWTNAIDFEPKGALVARYRGGRGQGRNFSSLDDGTTQSALRFLMQADRALGFRHPAVHEASEFGRAALLAAQFPSGGFPQGWAGPVMVHPPAKARYPDYDWRTKNRIKEYWDLPTLNDGLAGTVAATLLEGWETYRDEQYRKALAQLGDFLLLAQMPDPQPAWAQQYDTQMRPVWARKFEPPAITGGESQDVMETLILIHRATGDRKYLDPIPRALAYLERSLLPDGRLARYYELRTNQPLYMTRDYVLTHDDSDVPAHYGWKVASRLNRIQASLAATSAKQTPPPAPASPQQIRAILEALDAEGRWMSTYANQPLVGQPKFKPGEQFLSSQVFCENLNALSNYVKGR